MILIFNDCKLDIPKRTLLVNHIKQNMYKVENRQQKFCHGDFHLGNMIVNNGELGIIDFDNVNIADPYEDLKPFWWNVFESEYFETGLINGYFNNKLPSDFFQIISLYAAESIIEHLPWALNRGAEDIKMAYKVMNSVLEWFDNFNLIVPTWYKGIL